MRSAGGPNFELAWRGVRWKTSRMTGFGGPSLHKGRGSVWVALCLLSAASAGKRAHINAAMAANNDKPVVIRLRFICLILLCVQREFHSRMANVAAKDSVK